MTELYDWNPMPHKVDIHCPECDQLAEFEFAEVIKIKLKKDISFFQKSHLFDYKVFSDSCGHRWHAAIYFSGLHAGSIKAIRDLPEGYEPENWSHSKYLYRSHGSDMGSVCCSNCHKNQKYILNWPENAYYSIDHKGQQLWAFNRESTIDLKNFISAKERKTSGYKWSNFLLHLPTVFKKKSSRDDILKKINKLLLK